MCPRHSSAPASCTDHGLAYENPPAVHIAIAGKTPNSLLEAGISVITTVNLQYLEKLCDEVERITGQTRLCTIPRGFLDHATNRRRRCSCTDSLSRDASPADRAAVVAEQHKLSRLRELALLVAASLVDCQLEDYLRSHGVDQSWGVQGTYPRLCDSRDPTLPRCWKAVAEMRTDSTASSMLCTCSSL